MPAVFFLEQKLFQKIRLSCTTSYGFLAPCQDLEKTNDTITRKHLDGWMDSRMGRPYFTGLLRIPPEVQQSFVIVFD